MNNKNFLKLDILIICLIPILATILSLLFQVNFFISTLLFYGGLSVYLSFRTRGRLLKTLFFSLIVAIPLGIVIEYLAVINGSWHVTYSILRVFGIFAIEDLLWGFLVTYSTVIFYEHFVDKGTKELFDHKMKYLIILLVVLVTIFFALLLFNKSLLQIPYAYLIIGFVFIIPPIITYAYKFPMKISRFVKVLIYFLCVAVLHEFTGLQLNHWTFPSETFIGVLQFFGHTLPVEEILFYFILLSVAILSYFEFFDDKL